MNVITAAVIQIVSYVPDTRKGGSNLRSHMRRLTEMELFSRA